MTLKFGTDGVRGRAYDELTPGDVERLAHAACAVLETDTLVVGTDTRESGPDFVEAICLGAASAGVTPWVIGVAPTPAVAFVAARYGTAGAMVSASHNPFHDNGVKFFGPGGRKLTDGQQASIERDLSSAVASAGPADVKRLDRGDLVDEYVAWINTTASGDATGLRVVIDCANGAASAVAADVLRARGATIEVLNDSPDGTNINRNCGSTDMSGLRERVLAASAGLGIAFDGDADRMLAVDRHGNFVDGDQIIAVCALDLHHRGLLVDDTVVVTVMTNLGFHLGMADHGVQVHETPVGDRHVLEALEANQWTLGGEQSGHVIFHELATTGDGLLTAVQLIDVLTRRGGDLTDLANAAMTRLPQRLKNVRVSGSTLDIMAGIEGDISAVSMALGASGRLLVRPSGTEPLIRVMAEAPTQHEADAAVESLIAALRPFEA